MNNNSADPEYKTPRILLIVLLCICTVAASTIYGLYIADREKKDSLLLQERLRGETLTNLAIASATLVWDLNEVAMQDALMAQMNLPDILGARVFQGNGGQRELFAEVRKPGFQWGDSDDSAVVLGRPLLRGEREIGHLEVAFNPNHIAAMSHGRIRGILLQNGIFAILLASLVTILVLQKRARNFLEEKSSALARANLELENEIQERNLLEQNLRHSRDEARLANKVKQEFLANMSHELRTPLNGILGLARLLSSGTGATPEEKECFALLQESGESLQTHLDDILTYTSIESGRLTLRSTEFDLDILIDEIFSRARSLAARKGLACEATTAGKITGRFTGDRQEVQRSIMALIHNAVKFTHKGGITLRVEWNAAESCLRVDVTDSGPGVPLEIEEKMYQPFVQFDTSASRRHSGLGLGLALASKVTTLAGGDIRCLNPGQPGAIFRLTFPLQPISKSGHMQSSMDATPGSPATTSFKILVVDDNDLNRRVLRLILTKAGIASSEAASGLEAIDALQTEDYDLILMDVQMPEMDGLEATRRIRAELPSGKQPFIIALTAHALPSDRQLCLDAGMDEYLSKPVEADRLLRWIDRLRRLPLQLRSGLSATRK